MINLFSTNFPPQNTPIVDSKGNMTTPGMAFFRALFDRTGQGPGLVNQVTSVDIASSPDLLSDWNFLSTSGGNIANLPALTGGQLIMVQNSTGGNVTINPPSGATIDGGASYSLPDTKMQVFWFISSSQIISTQLG